MAGAGCSTCKHALHAGTLAGLLPQHLQLSCKAHQLEVPSAAMLCHAVPMLCVLQGACAEG